MVLLKDYFEPEPMRTVTIQRGMFIKGTFEGKPMVWVFTAVNGWVLFSVDPNSGHLVSYTCWLRVSPGETLRECAEQLENLPSKITHYKRFWGDDWISLDPKQVAGGLSICLEGARFRDALCCLVVCQVGPGEYKAFRCQQFSPSGAIVGLCGNRKRDEAVTTRFLTSKNWRDVCRTLGLRPEFTEWVA
jgi:hypothetical protein